MGGAGSRRLHVIAHGFLQRRELVLRQGNQEGLEEHFGFAQTGVEIIVAGIESGPEGIGVGRKALGELRGGLAKFVAELLDQIVESADFLQELGAMREQNVIEQSIPPGGTLAFRAQEIGGVERGGVGDRAVVLCVLGKGAEKSGERLHQAGTQRWCNPGGLVGL